MQLHNVLVFELFEEHNLAVGPLGVGGVLERVEYLLQSHHLLSFFLLHPPDVSISSTTDLPHNLKPPEDVLLNFVAHELYYLILKSPFKVTTTTLLLQRQKCS